MYLLHNKITYYLYINVKGDERLVKCQITFSTSYIYWLYQPK